MANDDVMTWFPRAEDYEVQQTVQPDETTAEKIQRLNDAIELSQTAIKEVVDGNEVCLEHKVYRAMDTVQDLDDFAKLLKECEEEDARGKKENAEALKKARVGIMNLKAYMGQVNVEEFAAAIRNENQFKVGCEQVNNLSYFQPIFSYPIFLFVALKQGLGPWLSWTERRMSAPPNKPKDFQEAVKCEEDACKFLKEVVKGNKALKTVQVRKENTHGKFF